MKAQKKSLGDDSDKKTITEIKFQNEVQKKEIETEFSRLEVAPTVNQQKTNLDPPAVVVGFIRHYSFILG